MSAKWRTVKIPGEMYKLIEEVVDDKKYGYKSVSDFVVDAVRSKLRELGKL